MVVPTQQRPAPAPRTYLRRERAIVVLGLIGAAVASTVGAFAGGTIGRFAAAGLSVWPFLLVGWLAHLGVRRPWARVLSWIGAGLVLLGLAVVVVGMAIEGDAAPVRHPRAVVVAVMIASILTGLLATPLCRPLLRTLGMRPDDHVHRLAVFFALGITLLCLAPLVGSGGRAILLDWLVRNPDADSHNTALDSLLPLIWIIPGAFVLVGYGVHRGGAVSLDRLGLRWPGRRALAWGLVAGLALVPISLGGGLLLERAAQALGLPMSGEAELDRLFDVPALTLWSSFAMAVAAGVGEELAVRGVLQPRLGLVTANLLFASLHALQYTIDGVIVVFLLGLALGWLRRRTNTVASIAAHVTYDLVLFVLMSSGAVD